MCGSCRAVSNRGHGSDGGESKHYHARLNFRCSICINHVTLYFLKKKKIPTAGEKIIFLQTVFEYWTSSDPCCLMHHSSTALRPFVALIVMQSKCANQVCCPQLESNFLIPCTHKRFYIPKVVEIIKFLSPLGATPCVKSAQISEVAQIFPCCIIMKTLHQREKLFKKSASID